MLKRTLKFALRYFNDLRNGLVFAKNRVQSQRFEYSVRLSQPYIQNETLANKRHNLAIATQKIEKIIIFPNETFSIWRIIGSPILKNGYKAGRTIENGVLTLSVGGGLCQISGLLHHLALMTGLEITERFPHSKDIYTEKTRFAPLGTDATIVYGHKDFRFKNNLQTPIYFQFEENEEGITAVLYSENPLIIHDLAIETSETNTEKHTKITSLTTQKIVSETIYNK